MKCPECGKEMRNGYLFCSKDGAFSFANEVPGVFTDAKKADGFVKITEVKPSLFLDYPFFTYQFVVVGLSTC